MKIIIEKVSSCFDWVQIIFQFVLPFLGVVIGAKIGSSATYRVSKKTIEASRKNEEISEIKEVLNNLYFPLVLLIRKNKILNDLFKAPINNPEDFRTLTALLEGRTFEGNDAVLLESILEIDEQLNDLILSNMNKISKVEVVQTLSKASIHFDIIKLAKDKKISKDAERFSSCVYPRELLNVIEEEINRLTAQLKKLEE